jgi:Domain of Unknown Function (DUF1543)
MTDSNTKKLYLVHTGFYDKETNFGIYESHTNFFVAASSPQEAKQIVKAMPAYKAKKMHTDGVQEIEMVQGFRVKLQKEANTNDDLVNSFSYDQLNPSAPISNAN